MVEDQVSMAESPPEDVPSAVPTAEQPVRRSGRITNRPKNLSDYIRTKTTDICIFILVFAVIARVTFNRCFMS